MSNKVFSIFGTVDLVFDKALKGLSAFDSRINNLGARAESAFGRVGASSNQLGNTLTTGLTRPTLKLGQNILTIAADFEKSMNQVAAVSAESLRDYDSAVGQTGAAYNALREMAKDLGKTTKFTAGEAAEGLGYLAMAGFDVESQLAAMPGVLQLAAAGNMDLAAASDIASNVLTGYGFKADEIARVNDVMAKTFTSTNTDMRQLGDAMKYVAPVAASAGLEFEQVSAAIGLLGNAGIQGEMGGTALRGVISRLIQPTNAAQDALRGLGIVTVDSSNKFLPLTDIIKQFEDITDPATASVLDLTAANGDLSSINKDTAATMKALGLITGKWGNDTLAYTPGIDNFANAVEGLGGDTELTGSLFKIFGQRAGPAMAALLSQGSGELDVMTEKLRNAGGTAAEVEETQMKGLTGAFLELKSALEGLAIAVGDSGFLAGTEKLVDQLAVMVRAATELDPALLRIITVFSGAVAAIGPLLIIFGQLNLGVSALMPLFQGLGGVLAFMSSPMGIAVVGIIALVTAFANWDAAVTATSGIMGDFISTLTEHREAINDFVNGILESFETMTGLELPEFDITTITEGVEALANSSALQDFVRNIEIIRTAITTFAQGETVSSTVDSIGDVFNNIVSVLEDFGQRAANTIENLDAMGRGAETAKGLFILLRGVFDLLASSVTFVYERMTELSDTGLGKDVVTTVKILWDTLNDTLKVVGASLTVLANLMNGSFKGGFSDFADEVAKIAGVDLSQWASSIKSSIGAVILVINSATVNMTKVAIKWGLALIDGFNAGLKAEAGRMASSVKNFFGDVLIWIKNIFGIASPSKVLHTYGVNVATGFINGVRSMVQKLRTTVTGVFNNVLSILQGLPDSAIATGSSAINSLAAGIISGIGVVSDAVQAIINSAIARLQALPAEAAQVGADMANALASSIQSGVAQAQSAVRDLASSIDPRKIFKGKDKEATQESVKLADAIVMPLSTVENRITTALKGALSQGVGSITRDTEKVKALRNLLTNSFNDIGADATAGLVKGMESETLAVLKAAEELGLSVPAELKRVLQIQSPAKATMPQGRDAALGFAMGIKLFAGAASEESEKLAEGVTKSFKDYLKTVDNELALGVVSVDQVRDTLTEMHTQLKANAVEMYNAGQNGTAAFDQIVDEVVNLESKLESLESPLSKNEVAFKSIQDRAALLRAEFGANVITQEEYREKLGLLNGELAGLQINQAENNDLYMDSLGLMSDFNQALDDSKEKADAALGSEKKRFTDLKDNLKDLSHSEIAGARANLTERLKIVESWGDGYEETTEYINGLLKEVDSETEKRLDNADKLIKKLSASATAGFEKLAALAVDPDSLIAAQNKAAKAFDAIIKTSKDSVTQLEEQLAGLGGAGTGSAQTDGLVAAIANENKLLEQAYAQRAVIITEATTEWTTSEKEGAVKRASDLAKIQLSSKVITLEHYADIRNQEKSFLLSRLGEVVQYSEEYNKIQAQLLAIDTDLAKKRNDVVKENNKNKLSLLQEQVKKEADLMSGSGGSGDFISAGYEAAQTALKTHYQELLRVTDINVNERIALEQKVGAIDKDLYDRKLKVVAANNAETLLLLKERVSKENTLLKGQNAATSSEYEAAQNALKTHYEALLAVTDISTAERIALESKVGAIDTDLYQRRVKALQDSNAESLALIQERIKDEGDLLKSQGSEISSGYEAAQNELKAHYQKQLAVVGISTTERIALESKIGTIDKDINDRKLKALKAANDEALLLIQERVSSESQVLKDQGLEISAGYETAQNELKAHYVKLLNVVGISTAQRIALEAKINNIDTDVNDRKLKALKAANDEALLLIQERVSSESQVLKDQGLEISAGYEAAQNELKAHYVELLNVVGISTAERIALEAKINNIDTDVNDRKLKAIQAGNAEALLLIKERIDKEKVLLDNQEEHTSQSYQEAMAELRAFYVEQLAVVGISTARRIELEGQIGAIDTDKKDRELKEIEAQNAQTLLLIQERITKEKALLDGQGIHTSANYRKALTELREYYAKQLTVAGISTAKRIELEGKIGAIDKDKQARELKILEENNAETLLLIQERIDKESELLEERGELTSSGYEKAMSELRKYYKQELNVVGISTAKRIELEKKINNIDNGVADRKLKVLKANNAETLLLIKERIDKEADLLDQQGEITSANYEQALSDLRAFYTTQLNIVGISTAERIALESKINDIDRGFSDREARAIKANNDEILLLIQERIDREKNLLEQNGLATSGRYEKAMAELRAFYVEQLAVVGISTAERIALEGQVADIDSDAKERKLQAIRDQNNAALELLQDRLVQETRLLTVNNSEISNGYVQAQNDLKKHYQKQLNLGELSQSEQIDLRNKIIAIEDDLQSKRLAKVEANATKELGTLKLGVEKEVALLTLGDKNYSAAYGRRAEALAKYYDGVAANATTDRARFTAEQEALKIRSEAEERRVKQAEEHSKIYIDLGEEQGKVFEDLTEARAKDLEQAEKDFQKTGDVLAYATTKVKEQTEFINGLIDEGYAPLSEAVVNARAELEELTEAEERARTANALVEANKAKAESLKDAQIQYGLTGDKVALYSSKISAQETLIKAYIKNGLEPQSKKMIEAKADLDDLIETHEEMEKDAALVTALEAQTDALEKAKVNYELTGDGAKYYNDAVAAQQKVIDDLVAGGYTMLDQELVNAKLKYTELTAATTTASEVLNGLGTVASAVGAAFADSSPFVADLANVAGTALTSMGAKIAEVGIESFSAGDALGAIGAAASSSSNLAVQAIGGLVTSLGKFASGDVVGGVVSLVATGIQAVVGWFTGNAERAKKARESIEKYTEAFKKNIGETMNLDFKAVAAFVLDDGALKDGLDEAEVKILNAYSTRIKQVADIIESLDIDLDMTEIFNIDGTVSDKAKDAINGVSAYAGSLVENLDRINRAMAEGVETVTLSNGLTVGVAGAFEKGVKELEVWQGHYARATDTLKGSLKEGITDLISGGDAQAAGAKMSANLRKYVLEQILDSAVETALASGVLAGELADITTLISQAIADPTKWSEVNTKLSNLGQNLESTMADVSNGIVAGIDSFAGDLTKAALEEKIKEQTSNVFDMVGGALFGVDGLSSFADGKKTLQENFKKYIIDTLKEEALKVAITNTVIAKGFANIQVEIADALKSGDWSKVRNTIATTYQDLEGAFKKANHNLNKGIEGIFGSAGINGKLPKDIKVETSLAIDSDSKQVIKDARQAQLEHSQTLKATVNGHRALQERNIANLKGAQDKHVRELGDNLRGHVSSTTANNNKITKALTASNNGFAAILRNENNRAHGLRSGDTTRDHNFQLANADRSNHLMQTENNRAHGMTHNQNSRFEHIGNNWVNRTNGLFDHNSNRFASAAGQIRHASDLFSGASNLNSNTIRTLDSAMNTRLLNGVNTLAGAIGHNSNAQAKLGRKFDGFAPTLAAAATATIRDLGSIMSTS